MQRWLVVALSFLACCAAGVFAAWLAREVLGGWSAPLALAWVVLVSKAFAVALGVKASADH